MKKLALHISRKMTALLIAGVIVVGLLIAAFNAALPWADSLRQPVERTLGAALGVDVRIGRIVGRWTGYGPRLALQDVRLTDVDDPDQVIHADELQVDLALFRSLRERRILLDQVILKGVEFTLFHYRDGHFSVSGLKRPGSGSRQALRLFVTLPNILMEETVIHWRRESVGYRDLVLRVARAQLRNAGDRHQIDARLVVRDSPRSSLSAVADFYGDLDRPSSLHGDIYLKARHLALGAVLAARLPASLHASGAVGGELWAELRRGRVPRVDARLAFDDAGIAMRDAREPVPLDGRFALRWQGDEATGWRLDLKAESTSDERLPRHVAADFRPGSGYRMYLDRLAVEALSDAPRLAGAASRKPSAKLAALLAGLAPRGRLEAARIALNPADDESGPPAWRVDARIVDLATRPWKKIPGVGGVNAHIAGGSEYLTLDIDSEAVTLDTAGLFREPLHFSLRGSVALMSDVDGIHVAADDLHARNADLATRTTLSISVPRDGGAPLLDIVSRFHDGDATHAARYYPTRVMKKGLVAWLDKAFPRGRVVSGGFVLYGPLNHFPFDKSHDGRFQVLFDVADMQLHYLDGWPDIARLSAEAEFSQNSLSIRKGHGHLSGIALSGLDVSLDPLRGGKEIRLRGRAVGQLEEALRIVRPHLHASGYLDILKPHGKATAALALKIPLGKKREGRPVGVRLDVTLKNNRLVIGDGATRFDDIDGVARIDASGLTANGLRASWLGNRLSVDVSKLAGGGSLVTAEGRLSSESLGRQFPAFKPPIVTGAAGVHASLRLPHGESKRHPVLTLESDLDGIRVDMPAPFGKPAAEKRELDVQLDFESKQRTRASFRYANQLSGQALVEQAAQGMTLRWAQLHCGAGKAPTLWEKPGIQLTGELPELDAAAWQAWLRRVLSDKDTGHRAMDVAVDITTDKLISVLGSWPDARLKGEWLFSKTPATWRVEIDAKRAKGRVSRVGRGPVKLVFDHLLLDAPNPDIASAPSKPSGVEPTAVPPFDLHVGRLVVDKHLLGELGLAARRTRGGLRFENLRLQSVNAQIDGDGRWVKRGGKVLTEAHLDMRLERLGEFLEASAVSDKVHDGSGHIDMQLTWPGSPADFALRRLDGKLDVDLRKARFVSVKPGIAKLLGLVSLDAISRRFKFDFDDVMKKGLYVDRAKGLIRVESAGLHARDFVVTSPMGSVTLSGRVGLLPPQPMDVLATVVPELGSTVTVAGAVAGGPVVAAVLLLARDVLKKQMDKATTLRFRLTGTLDKPVTKRLLRPSAPHADVSNIHDYEEDATMR